MKKLFTLLVYMFLTTTLLSAASITSFSPASGPVGTTVTITGTGFNATAANNVVFFGATRAQVTAATATSLTVTVPVGATYQYISVSDISTGLTAYSAQPFVVTFAGDGGNFAPKANYTTGMYPLSVAIGDLDGDGKPDLAVACDGFNTVSVLRNTGSEGNPNFAAKVDYYTGTSPYSVAIGDLDGDGRPDLAVANNGSNTVCVLRNTGSEGNLNFAAKVDYNTDRFPFSVAIGDLNGDGKPDLATANASSVSVLRNTGSAGNPDFATKVDYNTGPQPQMVVIGDLDGDGKPDLATANKGSSSVSVLRNTGSEGNLNFAAKVDYTTGSDPQSVAIGDLDGDGKPDLATANYGSNTVSVLRNTGSAGNPNFAAKVDYTTGNFPYSVAIGDLDGDGKPDLAVANYYSNTVSVLRNTGSEGNPNFATKVDYTTGTKPVSVSIGDLDGDGRPDLAVANYGDHNVSVLRNIPPPPPAITSFSPASGPVGTTVTITGTGFNATAANNVVFFGATRAQVTAATATSLTVTVPVGATYQYISVSDISTGLTAYSAHPFVVTFAGGSENFAPKADYTTGWKPYIIAIGDLDGDGKPDLAVVNYEDNTVSVLRNTGSVGNPNFAAKVDFTTGAYPSSVAIGDLDGDGKPDLAVANSGSSSVSVLRNTGSEGNPNFAAKVDYPTRTSPSSVAIGDLDGDGKPDLAVANKGFDNVSVLLNTGSAGNPNFAEKVDYNTGSSPYCVAIGDLDGDGKPDLAVANNGSNTVSVLLNTGSVGNPNFATKVDYNTGVQPHSLAIGDLDGDGKPDLAVANYASNTVSLLRNTGSEGNPNFATKVDYNTGVKPFSVAIGDLDGDGKPDLATANYGSSSVSVLRNTGSVGNPNFAPKADYTTGADPLNVAIGDLDGDGRPDLAVANNSSSSVSVLRNLPLPPAITSFSPASGPVGTTVTITGTGFNATAANNVVFFGATRAQVTAATATSLTVTVPVGATYQYISVSDISAGLTAYSAQPFVVTFAGGGENFAPKADYTTGASPYSVAIGDLDGDGKPDLAVANSGSSLVSVLRNTGSTGSPSFAAKADYPTGTKPYSVAIGDLDGDGRPDLAVANNGSNTVSVLLNTCSIGTISFAAKADYNTGSEPSSIAIGDLDGDGKPDLAVTNRISATVSVLRNLGSGIFATKADYTVGTNPWSIAIGDLDGDGKPDLAVANYSDNNVSVLRNTGSVGNPNFAPKADYNTGSGPQSVAISDLDGDGKPDLATANYTSDNVSVLRNTGSEGNPNFAAKVDYNTGSDPYSVAIGDLDGDGKPDLAVANYYSNTASVLRNTGSAGNPNFATKADYTTGTSPLSVAIGDLDGDGRPDLAVANFRSSSVSVLRNIPPPPAITSFSPASGPVGTTVTITGTGFNATAANNVVFFGATRAQVTAATATSLTVTVPVGATYQYISVSDISTGLTAYSAQPFVVTFAGGGENFAPKADYTTGWSPYSVAIGDLDGDGKPDLAVANYNSNTVSVLLNTGSTGNPNFATKADYPTGSYPSSVAIGDLDGDGKPDLAVANYYSNTVSVLLNTGSTGNPNFATKADYPTGSYPSSVAIGDLDGDGKPDLAVANTSSSSVSVLRNTCSIGTISFATKVDYNTGSSPRSVTIGDLDGDGKPDLAVANYDDNTVSVLRNTGSEGTPNFAAKVDFITGSKPYCIAIGDLDGDGKPDLAVANNSSSSVSVLRNTGAGTPNFAAKVDYTTGSNPISVTIGDLDGDGRPDLATANAFKFSDKVSVLRNTGSEGNPNFAAKVDYTTGADPYSVAIGDLDGDGRPDLAVANNSSSSVSVLRNLPPPPAITSFSPASGPVGTTVTITGTNFTGATAVSFGGTDATSFSVVSATSITAVVASGASGDVSVTTPNGTGTKSGFTFIPAPVISSFTPTNSGNGLTVTITGTNFTGATAVTFGGTAASSFVVVSATSITAVVASGASGDVSVTTPGGTGTKSGFTWIAPPSELSYVSSPITATYGIAIVNATPTVTGTVDSYSINPALPDGLNFNTTNGTISGTPTTISEQTDYTVTATNVVGNTTTTVTVTINKKELTVTGATTSDKVYDGTVTASVTGGTLNGIAFSDAITLTLAGTFADKNAGNSIAITSTCSISGTNSAYYTFTQPTLTARNITQKALTITAEDKTKEYDGAVYSSGSFTVSYDGFVTGDNETVLEGTLAFSGTATTAVNAGTAYVITPGGLTSSNYNISFVDGKLDITQKALTITAENKTKEYDGAVYSSGSFTVSYDGFVTGEDKTVLEGTLAFSGTATTAVNAGTAYVITPGGLTSSNYNISFVDGKLDITQKALTITAENKTKEYDGAVYSSGSFTVSYDGFVTGEDKTVLEGTLAFSGTATTAVNAGTAYVITPGGLTSSNYNISFVDGKLDITQKALTITAEDKTKVYDGAVYSSFTVSYDGFVTGEDKTVLEGTLAFSGTATTAVNAGTAYVITPGGLTSSNYNISFVDGKLDITQKALTITAEDKTKVYDGAVYSSFTVSYDGFVTGEDKTVLEGTLAFSGTATTAVNAGTAYVITPGGLTSSNYNITFVDGKLDITQKALTITAEDKTKVYDGAVYSSGSFTVSYDGFATGEDKTVLGGTLAFSGTATTAVNAGTAYVITPDGLTSSNYNISFVDGKLDITQKALTITAEDKTKEYDGAVYSSFTVSYDGFVTGEDKTVLGGTLAFSGTATTAVNAGTAYVITPGGLTSSNYNISFVDGKLDITQKALTITAEDKTKEYDGAVYSSGSFTVSYDGFITDEDKTVLGGTLAFSGTATTAVNAGTAYVITPDGLTSSNYNITFVNGKLDITQKALTITAEDKTKVYDGAVYSSFTVSYDGFVTGDNETVLGGTLAFSGTATTAVNAGTAYVITPGGLTSSNYNISFVDGKLDITQKALTITAEDKTKVYDGAVYSSFTVSYDGFVTGEDKTVLGGTLAFSGTATTAVNVGTAYVITPGGLTSSNYNISFANGSLTIVPYIAGDTDGDGKITSPEVAGDANGDGQIGDGEVAGDTDGDGKITAPEIAGDTNGDGQIGDGEVAGDKDGDGKITAPEVAGDANGDGQIGDGEVTGDTDGDGKITAPEVAGDANGDGQIGDGEVAGDTDGDGKITAPEVAGDANGDGQIGDGEVAGDTDGDGKITAPEVAGDANGDGQIGDGEVTGDTDGDGKITAPEVAGDTNGDGQIGDGEVAGDKDGDGKITAPEVAGDTDGNGTITDSEKIGDTNGDGSIDGTEIAGDENGDGQIGDGETAGNTGNGGSTIAGDINGDGVITAPEIAGDINGDGQIGDGEVAGDKDGDGKITAPEVAGDTNGDGQIGDGEVAGDKDGDGKITAPEVAGDTDGNGTITDPEKIGDTNGDGSIDGTEIAGDENGDGQIDDGETAGNTGNGGSTIAGDINGDGVITAPEIAGDTNGDGQIGDGEVAGDKDGDGKITAPEVAGDTDGNGTITDSEKIGDTNGDGSIDETEIAGDENGDGQIDDGETAGNTGNGGSTIAGDINGDGVITAPEIAGDINGDGQIGDGEVAGDKDGDGKITAPEVAGDTNGDGQIGDGEVAGDKDGDGKITAPEVAGDANGDGQIGDGEVTGDTDGDGKITAPEVAGDTNGDGQIGDGEVAGDKDGDGKITAPEVAGDTDGNGTITDSEKIGDTNGDGSIDGTEIAGDENGDGQIDDGETAGNTGNGGSTIAGDINGDGVITAPEIAGDINGDGQIGDGEVAGDTDGDGKITAPEVAGDTNGDGQIGDGEVAGDKDGDGKITAPEVAGDTDGNGTITDPEKIGDTNGDGSIDGTEIAGDENGDGQIDDGETAGNTGNGGSTIAGDINGDGVITAPEIAGDTNGDGQIGDGEVAGDKDGDGKITAPEVAGDTDGNGTITDPEKIGDTNGDGSIDETEIAGDENGDGQIDDGETAGNTGNGGSTIAGDINGDGVITAPEIAGDTNGDGQIGDGEVAGDKDGDGKITAPEVAGDTDGNGTITDSEKIGDTNGDGSIDETEIAGDENGDGQIDDGETAGNTGNGGSTIAGDINGDGVITAPEIAGDTNGDGQITKPEIAGDTNGDGQIGDGEVAGDTDGDGTIGTGEIKGDSNGDGKINNGEGQGDTTKSNQTITFGELINRTFGDSNFNLNAIASSGLPVSYTSSNESVATISDNTVTITGPGITTITAMQSGNSNYNAASPVTRILVVVDYIAGDTNHDGQITSPEIAGDTNGDGQINDGEIAGDTNGDGNINNGEVAGDTDGDGKITDPEIAGDTNGDGNITEPEIAGDTNGDGNIAEHEIAGDTNGDGQIGDGETAEGTVANISILTIDGTVFESPDDELYLLIGCDDEREYVPVSFTLEANATSPNSTNFAIETNEPGLYHEDILVISADGTVTRTYRIVIEKRFRFEDIVVQKYNNVLLVNNNSETNGGYRFISFNWYRDGQLIGTGQSWSAGNSVTDKVNESAYYSVEMETEEGEILQTCEASVTQKSAFTLKVSPNPVVSGSTIDITTTYTPDMLADLEITVRNLNGAFVMQERSGSNSSWITLPSSLTPGTYMVTTKAGGVELSTKIVVQ